jgi:two-component system, OmpR family, sensor histidine kinase CpxA
MRSLFLKIFLTFWLTMALFVALAIVAAIAFRPQTESPHWEYLRQSAARGLVHEYETEGVDGLGRKLNEIDRGLRIRAFLFDEGGRELSGRPVPEWATQLSQGNPVTPSSFWQRFSPRRFVSQTVSSGNGRQYTMVAEVPPRPWPLILRERPPWWLAVAVLLSGIVCYLLARYLTGPVARLRSATLQLAAGDLSARAPSPPTSRRDEIAELVRDFNTMASRLENLVNAQARLLNDISHELRSPLARLNVALGLARQRSGAEAQPVLERIELETTRLNELIGRLLTLARLESGEDGVRRTPVALDELVLDISKDAEFEAQARRCSVRCFIRDEATVLGSPALLHSAIENVVRNATRYTAEGTDVDVRLLREATNGSEQAVVRVTDHGPGVPQGELDKLFRPFYRLDDARGRQTGGVGLGLAITERAVRLHGGTVRAANRPEGGLMVEIRLPVDVHTEPAPPAPAHEAAPVRAL